MISRLAVNCFGAAQHAACAALIGAGRAADDASLLRPRQQKSSLPSLIHSLQYYYSGFFSHIDSIFIRIFFLFYSLLLLCFSGSLAFSR